MPKSHAFTTTFEQRVNELKTKIGISKAYDLQSGDSQPSIREYVAVWDTGATHSVISMRVVAEIGVSKIDMTTTHTVKGERPSGVYLANIYLPNGVVFTGVRVTDGDIYGGDVLIGMDIIGSGDFAVTHKHGNTRMTFQYPSMRDIDFVPKAPATGRQGFQNAGRRKRGR